MRLVLLLGLVGCASEPTSEVAASAAPPPGTLALTGPTHLVSGQVNAFVATGTLGDGEPVYLIGSPGPAGAGPCVPALGGACLPTTRPLILAVAPASGGAVTFDITPPPTVPAGATVTLVAAVVRGRNGASSLISGAWGDVVEAPNPGCTDAIADNYDPAFNVEDGSCVYSVVPCDGTFAAISTQADVAAYTSCSSLAGVYLYHDTEVVSLDLPNLEVVHGYVYLDHNAGLTSVDLSSLTTVDGYFYADGNADLASLDVSALAAVGEYSYLTNNPLLCADTLVDWAGISTLYAYLAGNGPCL